MFLSAKASLRVVAGTSTRYTFSVEWHTHVKGVLVRSSNEGENVSEEQKPYNSLKQE